MNERSQKQAGSEKVRNRGMSSSFAAALNTLLTSKIASPVRGTMGENHMCPLEGFGLYGERAPMEKARNDGTPNSGSW